MIDYIPRSDEKAIEWLENFISVLENGRLQLGQTRLTELRNSLNSLKTIMFKAHSPEKTTLLVHEKNEKLAAIKAQIRSIVKYEAKSPNVTDDDRLALGLHLYDNTRTVIGIPRSHVDYKVSSLDFGRVRIDFRDYGSLRKAKPHGMIGAIIAYATSDAPITSAEKLTHTILATRTPHILEFSDFDHGKTVYVSLCWQNPRGQRGPWNAILSAVVP